MTIQKGADLKLEIEDPENAGAFLPVGGFTDNSVRFDGTTRDASYKGTGAYVTLLGGGGTVQLIASGRGKLAGDAAVKRVQQLVIDRELATWRIHIPGLESYEGQFAVTDFGVDGGIDAVADYRIRIASSGPLAVI